MKLKTMPVGMLQANAHILWNTSTKEAIIIDCGGDIEKVIAFLEEKELTLMHIILTHGHVDHIMGVNALKKATGATVIAHQKERDMLEDANKNLSPSFGGHAVSVIADEWILEDCSRQYCGYTFSFYHTPGHTMGGMCIEVEGQLFTGDTLFKGSIGRTDLYGGNMQTLKKSLEKLKALSHRLIVHSGHGEKTTLREEISTNPYLK